MAGKKTGKRLLTWVLVLVMALSLLPLNALAAGGPETDGGSGMDFKKELLPNQPDGDGNYTIRMTAQATGKTTTTTEAAPMDIVLVLDQSGSLLGIVFNGFCFINLIPHFFDYLMCPYYPAYTMGCYQIVIGGDNGG